MTKQNYINPLKEDIDYVLEIADMNVTFSEEELSELYQKADAFDNSEYNAYLLEHIERVINNRKKTIKS